jgi:polysaccharide export outer membrane protein
MMKASYRGLLWIAATTSVLAITPAALDAQATAPKQKLAANRLQPTTGPSAPAALTATRNRPSQVPGAIAVREEYRIGPSDVLQITVWKEPQVSVPEVVVRSDGRISLPLIKEVDARGLRPTELEKLLGEKFSQFIEVPEVAVIVKEVHSEKVYVIGGVKRPGSIDLGMQMSVLQVLAEVGGLSEYAKKSKIYVLRTRDSKPTRLPFNYNAQLKGDTKAPEIVLQPGDTIVVPQ